MKTIKHSLILILMISIAHGQAVTQDSVSMIRSSYENRAIFLKEAFFVFNYKIVQGGFEYPAGKHFQDLPLYMSATPEISLQTKEVIKRRRWADRITLLGFAGSWGLLMNGLVNENPALSATGMVVYFATPVYITYEIIRFKNDLSRLVYEHNKSLLRP